MNPLSKIYIYLPLINRNGNQKNLLKLKFKNAKVDHINVKTLLQVFDKFGGGGPVIHILSLYIVIPVWAD